MKVLFISRKFPPQVGGMENQNYGLISNIKCDKKIIALKKSQKHLVWFLPYAFLKGLILAKNVDLICLGDGLLAPLGLLLKKLTRKPVVCIVHGLDVTFNNPIYQFINVRSLRYLDKLIAISRQTMEECKKRGIKENRCVFIPNGIDINKFYLKNKPTKKELDKEIGINLENKKILISVGRLVKRKGVAWFIKNVFPKLDKNIIYLVIGEGPERKNIKETIRKINSEDRIFLLGKVTDELLTKIYHIADLLIMPNIKIKNDMEGFGLVALEAASCGLLVVASKLEGLVDAITHNKNGFLVEPGNIEEFYQLINSLLNQENLKQIGEQAKIFTKLQYNWEKISLRYLEEFNKLVMNLVKHR